MGSKLSRVLGFLLRHGWTLLALAAVTLFFLPVLRNLDMYGKGDWGYFHFLDAAARKILLQFGEIPEWNPYQCGGNVLAANTQAQSYSPWFLLVLVFGPAVGAKLSVLGHALIGALGAGVLLGAMGLRGPGRFLGTIVFACSGFFGHQIAGGHLWVLPFYYLPGVLYLFLRGCREPRWAALAGGIWGLMVLEGGVYPVPYTGLLLGLAAVAAFAGWRPFPDQERFRPAAVAIAFGLAVAGFALIGAVKLLPALAHMADHPRVVADYDRITLSTLFDTLVSRSREWGWDRHSHHHYRWWGEYANYVGWAVLVLAAAALVTRFRRARVPFLLLMLGLAFSLGSLGPFTPWDTLHRLPVFENLRVPSRFGLFTVLALAFLAGLAVTEGERFLRARLTGRITRWIALLLPAAVALAPATDMVTFNLHPLTVAFVEIPPPPDEPKAPMKQVRGSYLRMYDHLARNHGTITCQEINPIPRSRRVREGDAEYGVDPPDAGSVRLIAWSPHRIDLEATLDRPARVWINQNHHAGWHPSKGHLDPIEGQLAVALPAGNHRFELRYRAPGLRAGFAMTVLGLLVIAGWFVFEAVRRRRRPGGDAVPPPSSEGAEPPREEGAAPATDAGAPPEAGTGDAPPASDAESRSPPSVVAGAADTPAGGVARAMGGTPPETPTAPRFSRRWWLRRVLPDAAFAAAGLWILFGSLAISEPGEAVWTVEVRDLIAARFREGDLIQFNPGWVGDAERRFDQLDRSPPRADVDARENGYRRLWYVYCRRDGEEPKLRKTLRMNDLVETFSVGHYSVYLLAARDAEDGTFLTERLDEAHARVVPRGEGDPVPCDRDDKGWMVCGRHDYQKIRVSRERIHDQTRRCVWMHPLADQAEMELTFPGALRGAGSLLFWYGLTDPATTAKDGGDVNVVLRAGRTRLRRVTAHNEKGWHRVSVAVPPGSAEDLVVVVSARNAGARHFCVNGFLLPESATVEAGEEEGGD